MQDRVVAVQLLQRNLICSNDGSPMNWAEALANFRFPRTLAAAPPM